MGIVLRCGRNKGKSSAQELTKEEIKSLKKYTKIINSFHMKHQLTSQVPSSQTQHKEGEKGSDVKYTENKEEVILYIGERMIATLKKGVGMFVSDLTTTPSGGGHTVLERASRYWICTDLGEFKEKDDSYFKSI